MRARFGSSEPWAFVTPMSSWLEDEPEDVVAAGRLAPHAVAPTSRTRGAMPFMTLQCSTARAAGTARGMRLVMRSSRSARAILSATRRPSLALVVLAACRSQPERDSSSPELVSPAGIDAPLASLAPVPAPPPPPAPVVTDWCIEGLSALDEDVCYVLPAFASGQPRRLLFYLHGIVPPQPDSPQKRAVETAVLDASLRAGVAAIVPRGRRGIGPGQARDWWAWPTTSGAIAELTPSIVARWVAAKKKLEALAGAPFDRTYLAGLSNGAYYLTALALRGEVPTMAFPVDGFGAMSGGAASAGAGGEPRREGAPAVLRRLRHVRRGVEGQRPRAGRRPAGRALAGARRRAPARPRSERGLPGRGLRALERDGRGSLATATGSCLPPSALMRR